MTTKSDAQHLPCFLAVLFFCTLVSACGNPFTQSSVHFSHSPIPCSFLNTVETSTPSPSSAQVRQQKRGEAMMIQWKTTVVATGRAKQQCSRVKQVVLQVKLYGPFSSLAVAQQISGSNPHVDAQRGPAVAASTVVTTNPATPEPYTNTLNIPANIQPGYYDLYQSQLLTMTIVNTGNQTIDGDSGGQIGDEPIYITK